MEWKYERYTIFKASHDRRGLRSRKAKQAELSRGAIVSIWVRQLSKLSNVRPRNFVFSTQANVMFPCELSRSLNELMIQWSSSTYFSDTAYRNLYQWAWTFNTYIHTLAYIHTYIHTYVRTYIHIFHGSASVSHRQYNVEAINTHIYRIFTV